MNPLSLVSWRVWASLAFAAALGVATLSYGHYQFTKGVKITSATYEAALSKQKIEAAGKLLDTLTKVHNAETALNDIRNKQELSDAAHEKTNLDFTARLNAATSSAGRLRDPNQARCGNGNSDTANQTAAASNNSANNSSQGDGLFSKPASELFKRITREADEINNAYISCRAIVTG